MTNDEREWWSPESLTAREREVRTGSTSDSADLRNDFASYRALASGLDPQASGLHQHNEVEPWRIDTVCRDYEVIVRHTLRHSPKRIADLGCGAGFTTDGLHRTWPDATATGFDVSHDAVRYARNRWTACRFVEGAIAPDGSLDGGPYDLILCQEFYPFTRTGSLETHREWMKFLLANMTDDGVAIIMVSAGTPESINDTYLRLRRDYAIRRQRIAAPRISRRLPNGVASVAGTVLYRARPQWVRNLYVLQRQ